MYMNPAEKLNAYKEKAEALGISLEAYLLLVAIYELSRIRNNTTRYERNY